MTPLGRFYVDPSGWPMPSVTTLLKLIDNPKLRAWRERVGDAAADAHAEHARGIGNRFHVWAEAYNNGRPPVADWQDTILIGMAACYQSYANRWNIRPIGAEVNLYSAKWGFAGTPDIVAVADFEKLPPDTLSVMDYKTSGQPGELWPLQLEAYAVMVEEHGASVGDVRALRLDKDRPGEMAIHPYPDPKYMPDAGHRAEARRAARRAFLSILTAWHWLHRGDVARVANQIQRGRLVPALRQDVEDDAA